MPPADPAPCAVAARLRAARGAALRNAAALDRLSAAAVSAAAGDRGGDEAMREGGAEEGGEARRRRRGRERERAELQRATAEPEPVSKHLLAALFGALDCGRGGGRPRGGGVGGDLAAGRYVYVPNEHGSRFLYGLVVPLLARILAASCPGLLCVVQLPTGPLAVVDAAAAGAAGGEERVGDAKESADAPGVLKRERTSSGREEMPPSARVGDEDDTGGGGGRGGSSEARDTPVREGSGSGGDAGSGFGSGSGSGSVRGSRGDDSRTGSRAGSGSGSCSGTGASTAVYPSNVSPNSTPSPNMLGCCPRQSLQSSAAPQDILRSGPEATAAAAAFQHHADQLKAHVDAARETDVPVALAAAGTKQQRKQLLQQQHTPGAAAIDKSSALRLICNGFEVLTGKMPEAARGAAGKHGKGVQEEGEDEDGFTLASVCWEKAGIVTPSRRDVSVEMMFSNGMTAITEGVVVSFTNGSMCQLTIRDPVDAVEALNVGPDTPVLLFSFAREGDKSLQMLQKSKANLFVVEIGHSSKAAPAAGVKPGAPGPLAPDGVIDSPSGAQGSSAPAPSASLRQREDGDSGDALVPETVSNKFKSKAGRDNVDDRQVPTPMCSVDAVSTDAIPNSVPLFVNAIAQQPSSKYYNHGAQHHNHYVAQPPPPRAFQRAPGAVQPGGGSGQKRRTHAQPQASLAKGHAQPSASSPQKAVLADCVEEAGDADKIAPVPFATGSTEVGATPVIHQHQRDPRTSGEIDISRNGQSSPGPLPGMHSGPHMVPASAAPYPHVHALPSPYHPAYFYGQPGMPPPPPPPQQGEYGAMQQSPYYPHPGHQAPHPGQSAHHPGHHAPPHAYMPHPAAHPQYLVHSHPTHHAPHPSHPQVPQHFAAYPAEYAVHPYAVPHHVMHKEAAAHARNSSPGQTGLANEHTGPRGVDALAHAAAAAKSQPYQNGHFHRQQQQHQCDARREDERSTSDTASAPRGHTATTKSSDSRDALEALVRMGNGNGTHQPHPTGLSVGRFPSAGTPTTNASRYSRGYTDSDGNKDDDDASGTGSSGADRGREGLARGTKATHGRRSRRRSVGDNSDASGSSSFTSGLVDASGQPPHKRTRR